MKLKFRYILTACLLLLTVITIFEMNDSIQEENYFILHYTPGPAWECDKPPNEQPFFAEHSRFLASLRSSGRANIGGRYSDKGMIIFSAQDRAQADSLLSTDPSVTHGTFTAELHPIRFFHSVTYGSFTADLYSSHFFYKGTTPDSEKSS